MEVIDFAKEILSGEGLERKLYGLNEPRLRFSFDKDVSGEVVEEPNRHKKIALSSKQVRFPRGHFHLDEKKAIALNSFANHELLAIEIMAKMLVELPHDSDEQKLFKKGIISSLKDEQKHLALYVERLNELGYEFGDFPLNDFFWRTAMKITTPAQYLSVMSITFEGANLDFAALYRDMFIEVEDKKTADILETVLKDEVSHVAFGMHWLGQWKNDKSVWQYYLENLPYPMTPARARGKTFNKVDRLKAKMDESFIYSLLNFDDEFIVTKRKEWKG